jgi:hypothetical protein
MSKGYAPSSPKVAHQKMTGQPPAGSRPAKNFPACAVRWLGPRSLDVIKVETPELVPSSNEGATVRARVRPPFLKYRSGPGCQMSRTPQEKCQRTRPDYEAALIFLKAARQVNLNPSQFLSKDVRKIAGSPCATPRHKRRSFFIDEQNLSS